MNSKTNSKINSRTKKILRSKKLLKKISHASYHFFICCPTYNYYNFN